MSTLNVSNITDGTDTVETGYVLNGSAKAYARYRPGSTLYNSFNISSGVDNGTGDGSVNLVSAMEDAEYNVSGSGEGSANTNVATFEKTSTTTASRIDFNVTVNQVLDDGYASPLAHGDLA